MKAQNLALVALLVAAGLYDSKAAEIFVGQLNDTQIEKLVEGLTNTNINPAQMVAAVTKGEPDDQQT